MTKGLPLLVVMALSSCTGGGSAPAPVATVNGVRISQAEVDMMAKAGGHAFATATAASALDRVVRDELAAQKAVAMGLDSDPGYRADMAKMEAEVAIFRRQKLAALYDRKLSEEAVVPEAEVRAYFDANADKLGSEVHVEQILLRDRAAIDRALADLQAGVPFDEVAARPFAGVPTAGMPWDLGWLRVPQMPAPWLPAVENLAPGQITGILEGEGNRFWIVKVVERRKSEGGFEAMKQALQNERNGERMRQLREENDRQLRKDARVVLGAR